MTNVLAPLGFTPLRSKVNAMEALNEYPMLFSNTEIIGIGDLVRLNSGNIAKCSPAQTPIGIFQGWYLRTRSAAGASMSLAGDGGLTMWKKAWNGAITLPTNMEVAAVIDDAPYTTFRVQCAFAVTAANRGALVDLSDSPGGPDLIFGRSKQKVGTPTTYFNITSIAVVGGGTGFVQNGVDVLLDGVILDLRPADVTVAAGAVTAITLLNPIHGLAAAAGTITVQAKPGFAGAGPGSFTPTFSGAQTAAQFRIERVLEQPFRSSDTSFNTVGYDLSNIGTFSWLEVAFAKHARGGTALSA